MTMTLQKQWPVDDISQLPQYLWMFPETSALVMISSKLRLTEGVSCVLLVFISGI